MNYKDILGPKADIAAITEAHEERQKWVNQEKKGFLRYRTPYQILSQYKAAHFAGNEVVEIGRADEVSGDDLAIIREQLRAFMPWRKGPFSVFDISVDAEWRSEKKWARLEKFLPDMRDKVVADIGCNNGYYMFRIAEHAPKYVLGLEPSVQHYFCFKALNAMAGQDMLDIDLLGVEHLPLFTETFDVLFLMGIIYHRPSPMDTLRDIITSLKPGGTMILETQGIPGDMPVAIFPDKTYAKVPGTYFVPTKSCLMNWMQKAGFVDIELFSDQPMMPEEQRKTEWMEFESYSDFLDPENPKLTVEGYPAPHRFLVKGRKKG